MSESTQPDSDSEHGDEDDFDAEKMRREILSSEWAAKMEILRDELAEKNESSGREDGRWPEAPS